MSETKWTPGPWSICAANDGDCICGLIWAHSADLCIGRIYKLECDFEDHSCLAPNTEQRRANERLVSTAPELYEALNDLACEVVSEHIENGAQLPRTRISYERALAALAKARGEGPR